MRRIMRWWRQPDHYAWLSGYLQARSLASPTQKLMAVISGSLALFPVNILLGPASFPTSVAIVLSVGPTLAGLGFAAMWLSRWPTRRQSLAFAMTGTACISLGCLTQPNPLIALMACTALAVPGGYLAFFHTAPFMVVNFISAVVIGAAAAVRLAVAGDVPIAISSYFLVVELITAVPLAIQIVVRALGIDLLQSDRDPLTGLLNRRAFEHAVVGVLLARRDADSFLALAMVDLDEFKVINDTGGHVAGDAALVAVSHALRDSTTETALIGRVGGEEFLVADVVTTAVPDQLGGRLCAAVSSVPFPLTASVGTASVALCRVTTDDAVGVFHQLVAEADTAMYAAKRGGGNRVSHHSVT
jgi:diguanylate cyclase (GGDEF)-like protein